MTPLQHGPATNLEDLRGRMTGHLALILTGTSALAIWAALPQEPPAFASFVFWALLLGLGLAVRRLLREQPACAKRVLVWGLLVALLGAMGLSADAWIPFAGLIVVFSGAMVMPNAEMLVAAVVAATAIWMVRSGYRGYPLPALLGVLLAGTASAKAAAHTLYTALEWAWNMQQQADRLLQVARDRQAELNSTLKSLDLAYTLQRHMQDEVIAARQRAEEAQRMKEQFAANLSHELRTPLNLILGFSEVMYSSPEVYGEFDWPPSLRRDIYQIYHNSSHLLEMIDDILDLSRFDIVGFALQREPTSIEGVLRSATEIASELFRGCPVALELDIAPDLPTLEIDPTRIRQVLLNLLKNAQRFTTSGCVRLEARRTDDEAIISVSDTGTGIPADKVQHIFDEFYQIDRSLSRQHGGAGLGLAICKRFVEAHDGRIWVESQEGVGSTFSFALPVPGQYALAPRLCHTGLPAQFTPRAARPTILVVEPDGVAVAMIRRHLEDYEVVAVDDVESVANEVKSRRPKAIVCNVAARQRCRPQELSGASVPIVECSLPSRAWVAHDLGVISCLTKPVTAQQFLPVIERLDSICDILLIDDDEGFGQLVQRILQTTGKTFVFRHALNGADGLAAMRRRRPDIVLLDLKLPDVDGFQLLETMRGIAELADTPVLLLTATSLAEDALGQESSQLVVHRLGGLRPAETLNCLHALLSVLEARYEPVVQTDVNQHG